MFTRMAVPRAAVVTFLTLSACGVEDSRRVDTATQTIVGGTVLKGDPEVLELQINFDNGAQGRCTGTLIGKRIVLTAAHCVDPALFNATKLGLSGANSEFGDGTGRWLFLDCNSASPTCTALHPGWNRQTQQNDIALVRLEDAYTLKPRRWNREPIDRLRGAPLRVVGYGAVAPNMAGKGVKRVVELPLRDFDATHVFLGDLTSKGFCYGDSGGPSFHAFPEGEHIVGVHSVGDGTCLNGADTRVDAYGDFIATQLAAWETPTCELDGSCAAACASPDPDCTPTRRPCTSAAACSTRTCVSDPQHPQSYCSSKCSAKADCDADMECSGGACVYTQLPEATPGAACVPGQTFCSGDTICDGWSAGTATCQPPCNAAQTCAEGTTCEQGAAGQKVCLAPRPFILPLAETVGPPAGCSAAPAWAVALAAIGLLRRRARAYPGSARA